MVKNFSKEPQSEFVGYLYTLDLINTQKMEHKITVCRSSNTRLWKLCSFTLTDLNKGSCAVRPIKKSYTQSQDNERYKLMDNNQNHFHFLTHHHQKL